MRCKSEDWAKSPEHSLSLQKQILLHINIPSHLFHKICSCRKHPTSIYPPPPPPPLHPTTGQIGNSTRFQSSTVSEGHLRVQYLFKGTAFLKNKGSAFQNIGFCDLVSQRRIQPSYDRRLGWLAGVFSPSPLRDPGADSLDKEKFKLGGKSSRKRKNKEPPTVRLFPHTHYLFLCLLE